MATGLHGVTAIAIRMATAVLLAALALSASAQTVRYIHTDALGSVAVVTDQNRNVLERREYEPYGLQLAPAIKDGPGYTGHVQDAATGLTYMQQRYYDPSIGGFLSVDPVTAYGGDMRHFNRYAYAYNNPYKFTDPDGRNPAAGAAIGCAVTGPACPGGAVIGAVIGAAIGVAAVLVYNEVVEDSAEPNPEAGTADSDEGCIYCVSGENTSSGKDYIGSTDNLGERSKDTSDGRDRKGAEVVDTYKKGDRADRQNKEQKAMNDRGGKENLDNKRNEVAPKKWEERGIEPPKKK